MLEVFKKKILDSKVITNLKIKIKMKLNSFKEEKEKRGLKFLLAILITIIVIAFFAFNFFGKSLKINFLDVGQGDCTLIETPENQVILIDGGNNKSYDYGEKVLMPYLLKHGITKIDYMFFSHMDSDHCRRTFLYFRKYES
jgi:competence protein ComEC